MSGARQLHVPVHYDLASTLCYVAHRTLPRLGDVLSSLEIELSWRPLDLAALLGWRRGQPVTGPRRENALAVAHDLGVPVRMPACWIDSRRAMAFGLAQADPAAAESWRERLFSAVFEEGRAIERDEELAPLARELGLELDPASIDVGLSELARLTEAARSGDVTGVPTFQLGSWPLGGIQSDETMRAILGRWAAKQPRTP